MIDRSRALRVGRQQIRYFSFNSWDSVRWGMKRWRLFLFELIAHKIIIFSFQYSIPVVETSVYELPTTVESAKDKCLVLMSKYALASDTVWVHRDVNLRPIDDDSIITGSKWITITGPNCRACSRAPNRDCSVIYQQRG
jgi:hypothetical protein